KAHHDAIIIDSCGSVPRMSSQVADVGGNTVFPKDGMCSADIPNRNPTGTRDADYLTFVIDCGGGAGVITRQRWQFLHLAVRFPDYGSKLQDLERRIAA